MRIESLECRVEHIALSRPYSIAGQPPVASVDNVLVRINADEGIRGLGIASPAEEVTGERFEACAAALTVDNLDWLIGRDLRECQSLCRDLGTRLPGLPAARAALDMALHDALGQLMGVPLCDLLGRAHVCLPTSITIGIKPLQETLDEADEYLGRGFRHLKIKTGDDLESDIERVLRLADHVGRKACLRVDANQGYTLAQTLEFARRTADIDIELIEQPTSAADPAALRALPAAERARVAADESLLDEADALALLAPPGACGIFNIKLMKCGGIRAGLRIAAMAETAGVALMWGCMDESVIGIAAALHAALASPATRYLDLDGHLDLARDLASGGVVLRDGHLSTSSAPGLGLEVC